MNWTRRLLERNYLKLRVCTNKKELMMMGNTKMSDDFAARAINLIKN